MASAGDIVFEMVLDDKGMVTGIKRAGSALKDFELQAKRSAKEAKDAGDKFEGFGHKFQSIVIGAGALRFALMDLHDVFVRLPMAILNTSGELEKMRVLMKGLSAEISELDKAAEGTKDFNYVINFAKNAPFDVKSMSDAFVKLKVAGIDPAAGSMEALVNSVAKFGGDGEVLKRASIAIQQMAGKGVISMEELRQQLGEAIPTAMQDMADGLGMTMAELSKAVKTGALQAGPALQAMFLQMQINSLGAAKEFMETWSGATSQLKTEWMLATETIANAGFAESSKDAVKDLVGMLRSPEFREFGTNLGLALGTAVKNIKDIVESIVRFRDEIGTVIKGLTLLWITTSAAPSIGKWASKAIGDLGNFANQRKIQINNIAVGERANNLRMQQQLTEQLAAERSAMMQSQINNSRKLADEQAAMRARIANRRAEIDQEAALGQQQLAQAKALQAKLDAVRGGVALPGQKGLSSRADVSAQIADLNAQAAASNQRKLESLRELTQEQLQSRQVQQSLKAEIEAQNAQLVTNAATLKASTAAQVQYAAKTGLTAIALKGVAAAQVGFNTVLGLMGGWIGLSVTALMGLAYWYSKVASDAEASAIRQMNAAKGVSSQEGLIQAQKELANEKKELARQQGIANTPGRFSADTLGAGRSDIEATKVKIEKLEKEISQSTRNVRKIIASDAAAVVNREMDESAEQIIAKTKEKAAALNKAASEQRRKVKEGSKEENEIRKQLSRDKQKILEEGVAAELKDVKAREKIAQFNLGLLAKDEQERATRLEVYEAIVGRRERLEEKLKSAQNPGGAVFNNLSDPKSEKSGAAIKRGKAETNSDSENFLKRLKEQREEIQLTLSQLTSLDSSIDIAATESARLKAKLANIDSDKSYIPQDKKNKEAIKRLAAQKEIDRKALKEAIDVNAENVKGQQQIDIRKKIIDETRQFGVDYESAMSVLENPDLSGMGKREMQLKKFFATLQDGGKSTEVVRAQFAALQTTEEAMMTKAKGLDAAESITSMRENLKKLGEEEIGLSLEVVRARRLMREEDYRKEMQEKIKNLSAIAGKEKEALQAQQDLNNEMALRNKKVIEETKTPVEKLGDQWKDTARAMQDATAKWATSSMDSITELVTTGETSFSKLANSIIRDLARIAVEKAMSGAVSSAASWAGGFLGSMFANGGIMTSMGSLPLEKYASGGIANSPQVAIFGEGRMNEAYVPLPDGRTIPVTMTGGGGGGSNVVSISINVSQGSPDNQQSSGADAGAWKEMANKVRGVVVDELVKQKRPGGALYS